MFLEPGLWRSLDRLASRRGYRVVKKKSSRRVAEQELFAEEGFAEIYGLCRPYTMTSVERMYALFKAMAYIAEHDIEGDVVECGVWKGGSMMLVAHTLQRLDDRTRSLFLYDTFAGMTQPSARDRDFGDKPAESVLAERSAASFREINYAALDEVKRNLSSTGYPETRLKFIEGPVEETIPETVPDKIALLRLDTDWYESTLHELRHLYPLLSEGGVLIIDDYGHWKGAREATDQYLREENPKILLNRIDMTCRLGVKCK